MGSIPAPLILGIVMAAAGLPTSAGPSAAPIPFPAPPAPPPAGCPLFIDDTFIDADGVLATAHTLNTGGTWAQRSVGPPFNGPINADGFVVIQSNGAQYSGNAGSGGSDDGTIFPTANAPPVADYFVEAIFDVSGAVGSHYWEWMLFARGTGTLLYGPSSNDFLFAWADNSRTTTTGRWANTGYGGATEQIQDSATGGFPTGISGIHKARIEVEGMVLRAYFDDTLLMTNSLVTTLAGAGAAPGAVGVSWQTANVPNVADVRLHRFRVGPLPYCAP
jgi:hypothetical protein